MQIRHAIAVGALAFAAVGSAQAFTTTGVSCSVTDLVVNATACAGAFEGNNLGNPSHTADVLAEITTDFGGAGWSLATPELSTTGGTAGSIDLGAPQNGPFVIALMSADAFSLYYYDSSNTGISSLDFITNGVSVNKQGIPQALSHASLYTAAVPEPETYALMLGGLAVMGFIARRRNKA